MKYKSGDTLYYVSPFVFTIELVKIEFSVQEEYGLFYIDSDGAYLAEYDLHESVQEAVDDAFVKLDRFYYEKGRQIINNLNRVEEGE